MSREELEQLAAELEAEFQNPAVSQSYRKAEKNYDIEEDYDEDIDRAILERFIPYFQKIAK